MTAVDPIEHKGYRLVYEAVEVPCVPAPHAEPAWLWVIISRSYAP
jgi:hypothetical protein